MSFNGEQALSDTNSQNNKAKIKTHISDVKNINELNLPKNATIILDPPRAGMHPKAQKRVLQLQPEKIIYVSCNPKRFAEELPNFKDSGFEIKKITLLPSLLKINCLKV